ncbi:hypothetical protein CI238_06791 [Colletotrichum incanum]|uniref:Uncharacterized protein n=1 Tax=Colletotrichum incanum TaxID=1573173 RepID=A0A167DVQ4_COLIC|nr:hypothetical protein CI238_06791 [Colletotrichum incanum]
MSDGKVQRLLLPRNAVVVLPVTSVARPLLDELHLPHSTEHAVASRPLHHFPPFPALVNFLREPLALDDFSVGIVRRESGKVCDDALGEHHESLPTTDQSLEALGPLSVCHAHVGVHEHAHVGLAGLVRDGRHVREEQTALAGVEVQLGLVPEAHRRRHVVRVVRVDDMVCHGLPVFGRQLLVHVLDPLRLHGHHATPATLDRYGVRLRDHGLARDALTTAGKVGEDGDAIRVPFGVALCVEVVLEERVPVVIDRACRKVVGPAVLAGVGVEQQVSSVDRGEQRVIEEQDPVVLDHAYVGVVLVQRVERAVAHFRQVRQALQPLRSVG